MIWGILILALILRVINLNQSLWLDEATQAILSGKPINYIVFERAGDFHPPLSYLILHFWMILGTSEIWFRLLSVLFGVATVLMVYQLVLKIFNKNIAILAAFLLAIAPYHIYYSQEVRMYSMAAFFATLSVYFLYRWNMLGFVLSTVALLYTHYMGFFLLTAEIIYIIFSLKSYKKYFSSLLIIGLIYLPWLPQFLNQIQSGVAADQYLPGWGSILSITFYKALPLTFLKFSIGRIDFDNNILYGSIALAVLSLFGYLLVRGIQVSWKKQSQLVVLWLCIPIILSLIISFIIPLNQPFRLLFILPAFYILLSVGISVLGKWRKLIAAIVILISLSGLVTYYLNPRFWREDWKGATHFINQNIEMDEIVLFVWPQSFPSYQWYQGNVQYQGLVDNFPVTTEQLNSKTEILEGKNGIYLFEYLQGLSDPNRLTQTWLTQNGFILKETYNFNGVGFIYKYSK